MTRLLAVRPEERRGTVAAFLTIFGTLAGHTLLETARDALFLARLPASQLSVVYLLIALVAVGLSQVPWGRRRATGSFALSRLLGIGAVVTLVFWRVGRWQSPLELYSLYVWTGLLGSLAVLQFWMVLGDLFTLTQAKRLYSLVWTGSLLGATVGAAAARLLAGRASTSTLVLAAAVVLGLTALGPAFALGRAKGRGDGAPAGERVPRGGRAHPEGRRLPPQPRGPRPRLDRRADPGGLRLQERGRTGGAEGGARRLLRRLLHPPQPPRARSAVRVGPLAVPRDRPPPRSVDTSRARLRGGGRGRARRRARRRAPPEGGGREPPQLDPPDGNRAAVPPPVRRGAGPGEAPDRRRGPARRAGARVTPHPLRERSRARGRGAGGGLGGGLARLDRLGRGPQGALPRRLPRRAARGDAPPRAWTCPRSTSCRSRRSSARSTARTTTRWWPRWTSWRRRAAPGSSPPSSSTTPRSGWCCGRSSSSRAEGRSDFLPVAERLLRHADAEIRAAALRARTHVRPDESAPRRRGQRTRARSCGRPRRWAWSRGGGEARRRKAAVAGLGGRPGSRDLGRPRPRDRRPALARLRGRAPAARRRRVGRSARAGGAGDGCFAQPPVPARRFWACSAAGRCAPRRGRRSSPTGTQGLAFLDAALGDRGMPVELRRQLPRTIALFDRGPAAAVLERHLLDERSGSVRYRILRGMNRLAAASGRGVRSRPAATGDRRDPGGGLPPRALAVGARARGAGGRVAARRRATASSSSSCATRRGRRWSGCSACSPCSTAGEDFKGIYRGLQSSDARARGEQPGAPRERPRAAAARRGPRGRGRGRGRGAPRSRRRPLSPAEALGYEDGARRSSSSAGGESLRCVAAHHVGELGLRALRPASRSCARRAGASSSRGSSSARSPRSLPAWRAPPVLDAPRLLSPLERLLHLKRVPHALGPPRRPRWP